MMLSMLKLVKLLVRQLANDLEVTLTATFEVDEVEVVVNIQRCCKLKKK